MIYARISSPVGDLLAVADAGSLTALSFNAERALGRLRASAPAELRHAPSEFAAVRLQLSAYFAGELRDFTLPLAPAGSPFEQRVWRELRTIPYGTTTSYGAIAKRFGIPNAARAVGAANGRNPIPIVIPCHRVIGSTGGLTGYGGGLARKRLLLDLEARHSGLFETPPSP
ncbi:MAG TPA: methylated-DNA--[protein]-cysteine S-methyltransferase [Gemmatimonadaceae bacterium]|nr:methylated-DNA--[protein]-cysteine S-methyltransferase [Gemmatimonadaceae bacterium]